MSVIIVYDQKIDRSAPINKRRKKVQKLSSLTESVLSINRNRPRGLTAESLFSRNRWPIAGTTEDNGIISTWPCGSFCDWSGKLEGGPGLV